MIARMDAHQVRMDADRKVWLEKMDADTKTWRERMEASHKEMAAEIKTGKDVKTMVCREMEARLEEKPTSVARKTEVARRTRRNNAGLRTGDENALGPKTARGAPPPPPPDEGTDLGSGRVLKKTGRRPQRDDTSGECNTA